MRAIVRSVTIGLGAVLFGLLADGVYVFLLCAKHKALEEARSGRPALLLDRSFGVPRSHDAVFACEVPHWIGWYTPHLDLVCSCGPSTDAAVVGRQVRGSCTLDALPGARPSACRPNYCDEHFD